MNSPGINQIRTYATAIGNQNPGSVKNARALMLVNKNEELAEQIERMKRVNNLIIHGNCEVAEDVEEGKVKDKEFAESLLKDLQIGAVGIKQIERIGQRPDLTSQKKRPIKLIFNCEDDKDKVLDNLCNLKGMRCYKGISITPDFTQSERQLIKSYNDQAKSKNSEEEENLTNYVWRVRGTPKNGLTIRRYIKSTPLPTESI